ncbi:MAG: 4Fe-4S binding protein [Deltaproteobacteria bacterium]|jgi:pyruvate ferredoxin oxidoreductase delta subunit|nr:4Fe-4S binding protein [Deltaproteobacteria bacterium]
MEKNADALMKTGDMPDGFRAKPGSSINFKTGDWRSTRPVLDREKCIYCGFCYIYCPDGVYQDQGPQEKYYKPDLDFCKGCGVCAFECPKKCITMVLEEV